MTGRTRIYIARDKVHAAALEALERIFSQPDLLIAGLNQQHERQRQFRSATREPRSTTLSRITRLRAAMDDLLDREIRADHAEDRASIARLRVQKREELDVLTTLLNAPERPVALPDPRWLARHLDLIKAGFSAAWEAIAEGEKRLLVNACISRIDVLCESFPGVRRWRREVVNVKLQPWVYLG